MTQLKKQMGWTYRDGATVPPIAEETIREIAKYMEKNVFSYDDIVTLSLNSKVAIEARSSSDWQGAAEYATEYKIVGAKYRKEQ